MSGSAGVPDRDRGRGAMFWLPGGGFGNGIPARNWAELADIPDDELSAVLFVLADARIGGYVVQHHQPRHVPLDNAPYRLWVDSMHYRAAEDILMAVLAKLHGKSPPEPPESGRFG